jgi:hypothetical protein
MPRARSKRKTNPQRARNIAPVPQLAIVPAPEKPVRGVKLKTVSRFAMVFALLCLGAFLAGRPPVSAADAAASQSSGRDMDQGMMMRDSSLAAAGSGKRERRKPRNARERGRPLVSCLPTRTRNTSSLKTSESFSEESPVRAVSCLRAS